MKGESSPGVPIVTVTEEQTLEKHKREWTTWTDEHVGFCTLDPNLIMSDEALPTAHESVRNELWAKMGDSYVKDLSANVIAADFPKPQVLKAVRSYMLSQIIKGKSPREPRAPKAAVTSNAYLLSHPIHYTAHRASNAMRMLHVLLNGRTEAVRKEIAVFTNGYESGINNAVCAASALHDHTTTPATACPMPSSCARVVHTERAGRHADLRATVGDVPGVRLRRGL